MTRSGPRVCAVSAIEPLTPRLLRLRIAGPGLVGLTDAGPDQRVKLAFPEGSSFGDDPAGWALARRRRRTYTLLDLDPDAGTAAVEFVLHGAGVAAGWAARARVGDELAVTEPVGRFEVAGAGELHLVADETGLPALRAIVACLPPGTAVRAYVEIHDAGERLPLPPGPAAAEVVWLDRAARGAAPGELLRAVGPELIAHLGGADSARVWVAGEAGAVGALRAGLLAGGVDRAAVTAVAYWKRGTPG